MVSSMVCLSSLPASSGSNARATARLPRLSVLAIALALLTGLTSSAFAQTGPAAPGLGKSIALFLAGGAVGLGAHESGHVAFDLVFDAGLGVDKVDFHGIPFFAITHRGGLPAGREFTISSAGFWVQHAGSEWLLMTRPNLRYEHAPFAKGVLAFNVLTSVAYASAAIARTGPYERDTRGLAASARIDEPWVGAMLLVPAALDTCRYFAPDQKWAAWASRAAKVGMVLLIARTR